MGFLIFPEVKEVCCALKCHCQLQNIKCYEKYPDPEKTTVSFLFLLNFPVNVGWQNLS